MKRINGAAAYAPVSVSASGTCVQTKEAFLRLAGEWGDLFERARCPHIFLSHEWMAEWWEQWGGGQELFLIAVRDSEGRLVAIAPFYIKQSKNRRPGVRVLAFIASTQVASDHLDILVEPGCEVSSIQEIVRLACAYRKQWDYIELADCDADSLLLAEMRHQFKAAGFCEHIVSRPDRPYAKVTPSFDEYLAGLAHRVRKNYRRGLRALEATGGFEFSCLTASSDIIAGYNELVRLHDERFKHLSKNSCFLEPSLQAFHSGLLKRMTARRRARLYLLQVHGRTVAALYGFSVRGRFSYYQSGMDPAWAELSVGAVSLGCSIRHAIETGHTEFDFLRGTQSYKLHWAKSSRQAVTVRFFDRRAKGSMVLLLLRVRRLAARLKKALRREGMRLWQQIIAKSQIVGWGKRLPGS
jgi:CelD/BcsL family acetyltransferase involved in cellulose biosynthesis